MVNNLVFRWPKPLLFMVLGAHGIYNYILLPEVSGDSWMYPYQRPPIGKSLYKPYTGYNPQESLENTINTIGILLGGTPNCPLKVVCVERYSKDIERSHWEGVFVYDVRYFHLMYSSDWLTILQFNHQQLPIS